MCQFRLYLRCTGAGAVLQAVMLATMLVLHASIARAVVYDYSMPLRLISTIMATNAVSLSVFDPVQGRDMQTNINSIGATNLIVRDGIVLWTDRNSTHYYTYDPDRTNWVGGSRFGLDASLASPLLDNGMAAWISRTARTTVLSAVYVPKWAQWNVWSIDVGSAELIAFSSADGVVVWATGSRIGYLTFDPADGFWKGEDRTRTAGITPVFNSNGVVAWIDKSTLFGGALSATYVPSLRRWAINDSSYSQTVSWLDSQGGVVAWADSPSIYYTVFDPRLGYWVKSNGVIQGSFSFAVSNATVHWRNTNGIWQASGYNPNTRTWQPNIETRPLAFFSVSTTNGNPPLAVHFGDMSIGAVRWDWDFGDGSAPATNQSPRHRYLNYAVNRPILTITSAAGETSSINRPILSDASAPVGRLRINGGDAWTSDTMVTLDVSASDNSGVVASNRFSNNNTNWTAWENFSTAKPWTLTPGYEPKTAYVQLSDAVGNVATINGSILYYTNPPPTVSFIDTNFLENTGTPSIQLLLSQTSAWPVTVSFIVTNGTATFGSDYSQFPLFPQPVVFIPGTNMQTIRRVNIFQDNLVESNETVFLIFDNLINAVAGPTGILTILDDDTPPLFTSPRLDQSSRFQMSISTAPGRRVTIQASSTLTNWVTLTTLTNFNGTIDYTDPVLPLLPKRFYRALIEP